MNKTKNVITSELVINNNYPITKTPITSTNTTTPNDGGNGNKENHPLCWCRLNRKAKRSKMSPSDPRNPNKEYWSCANHTCSFWEWAKDGEDSTSNHHNMNSSSTSSSSTTSTTSSIINGKSMLAMALAASTIAMTPMIMTSQVTTTSTSSLPIKVVATNVDQQPKPYKSSQPIPIPKKRAGCKSPKDEFMMADFDLSCYT